MLQCSSLVRPVDTSAGAAASWRRHFDLVCAGANRPIGMTPWEYAVLVRNTHYELQNIGQL